MKIKPKRYVNYRISQIMTCTELFIIIIIKRFDVILNIKRYFYHASCFLLNQKLLMKIKSN